MNKVEDRINRLIALKRLGIHTVEEAEELETYFRQKSAYRDVHDRIMCRRNIAEVYSIYRLSKQVEEIGHSSTRKERKERAVPLRVFAVRMLKYSAAVLLPFAVLLTCLIISNRKDKEEDIQPRQFVATLKSPDLKQYNLTIRAAESYSTQALNTIPVRKEQISDEMYLLTTSPENEFRLTLEDGTVIHLNHGTELYFPEHFDTEKREIFLRGEAYLRVAKDARPFLVVTDACIVRQYGTSFNVKAYDKYRTEVVLVEGSVGISHHPASGEESQVMLKPGQMCTFGETGKVTITEVDSTPYVAWETGRFSFEDYPLHSIMEVLHKWYHVDVVFKDEEFRKLRFSGDLDRYESIMPILKSISNVTGANVELSGNRVIIGN